MRSGRICTSLGPSLGRLVAEPLPVVEPGEARRLCAAVAVREDHGVSLHRLEHLDAASERASATMSVDRRAAVDPEAMAVQPASELLAHHGPGAVEPPAEMRID